MVGKQLVCRISADVIKTFDGGAAVTQLCSVLLQRGIDHLRSLEVNLVRWLEERKYASVRQNLPKHEPEELCRSQRLRACPVC